MQFTLALLLSRKYSLRRSLFDSHTLAVFIIAALDTNLATKAGAYRARTLQLVFSLNNMFYVQKAMKSEVRACWSFDFVSRELSFVTVCMFALDVDLILKFLSLAASLVRHVIISWNLSNSSPFSPYSDARRIWFG